jgi:hypothetical protein
MCWEVISSLVLMKASNYSSNLMRISFTLGWIRGKSACFNFGRQIWPIIETNRN